jgi:hypothetical protein
MPATVLDPLNDIRIGWLPAMTLISSIRYDGEGHLIDDMGQGLTAWADEHGISHDPGMRECFAYWDDKLHLFVFLIRVPKDFSDACPYPTVHLPEGLVAIVTGERDHLIPRFEALLHWLEQSDRYVSDPRFDTLVDWITPSGIHEKYDFEQQDMFHPINLR